MLLGKFQLLLVQIFLVIIYNKIQNQIIQGGTLNLEFILAFDNPEELQINNVKFNGKTIGKE